MNMSNPQKINKDPFDIWSQWLGHLLKCHKREHQFLCNSFFWSFSLISQYISVTIVEKNMAKYQELLCQLNFKEIGKYVRYWHQLIIIIIIKVLKILPPAYLPPNLTEPASTDPRSSSWSLLSSTSSNHPSNHLDQNDIWSLSFQEIWGKYAQSGGVQRQRGPQTWGQDGEEEVGKYSLLLSLFLKTRWQEVGNYLLLLSLFLKTRWQGRGWEIVMIWLWLFSVWILHKQTHQSSSIQDGVAGALLWTKALLPTRGGFFRFVANNFFNTDDCEDFDKDQRKLSSDLLQTIFRSVANDSFSGDNREDAFDKDQGEVVFENHRRRSSDLLQTIFLTDDCKEQFF